MTRKDVQTRSPLQLPALSAELTAVVNDTWTWRPSSVSEAVRNEAVECVRALHLGGAFELSARDVLGNELRRLFTVFWDRRPEQHWQALMQSYAEVIDHYPEAVIRAGVDECIKTATFLPKPSELRSACYTAMPADYKQAYKLRARLEAISRAAVATNSVAEMPLSESQKAQLDSVMQRLSNKARVANKEEQC